MVKALWGLPQNKDTVSNFTKLRYTWLCKSLKECGSCEAFIFVSNVIFVLHLWRVKAVRAFLVFCINNKWKICWNCEAFSICLFVFHNIWKICWSCEAFPICIFVFFSKHLKDMMNLWSLFFLSICFSKHFKVMRKQAFPLFHFLLQEIYRWHWIRGCRFKIAAAKNIPKTNRMWREDIWPTKEIFDLWGKGPTHTVLAQ